MAEGEKLCSLHRSTENSLAYSDQLDDQMDACIGESSVASSLESSTSDQSEDQSEIADNISTSPAAAFLKTAAPVFPSYKLSHHSSDSSLVAVTIKVPVIIHSWPDEQRKAQLVTGSQKSFLI